MKITGQLYRDMVISGSCCLENSKDLINSLNIFPVPDGDTGSNMSLTMSGVRSAPYNTESLPLSESAQKAANLMLRGARGNSGVILSLFFRGISKVWKENDEADIQLVIKAFRRGVTEAYKAVMKPTEGTILTVMRIMTETGEKAISDGLATDIPILFEILYEAASRTLEKTKEMLPQLKEADVVDSGGYGFTRVIEGMYNAVIGTPITLLNEDKTTTTNADFSSFDTESIKYAYCTECIITKSPKFKGENTADFLHQYIMKIGDSVVFVDDEEIIKLHVHTNKPGRVITEALRYGTIYSTKIENMKLQHSNLSGGVEGEKNEPEDKNETAEITKEYGFVTVCIGDGITSLFMDLAADQIVSGGQTMNPSTDDIVSAIEKTPAKNVFILPNNKNVCLVCEQAKKIVKDRNCIVIPSDTVAEGMAAMIAFDESLTIEENTANMQAAISNVTTVSMTYAVRDTDFGGTKIKEGETLGLINGKIVSASDSRISCMNDIISKVESADIVTVCYGEGANEEEAGRIAEVFSEKFPDADVMVISGGQPVYSYIISIE